MRTVKLPARHALDWLGRYDGGDAGVVEATARTATLNLGDDALRDLISDSHYYAEEMAPDNTGDVDYRPAARRCLAAIECAGIKYTRRGFTIILEES